MWFAFSMPLLSRGARRTAAGVQRLRDRWEASSLAVQFLAAGGVVTVLAMLLVGAVVTTSIERGVTRNAAATTALYVDSVVAPLLPDMRAATRLEDVVRRALDETLDQGALGRRLVDMRLWSLDGTVLYARDETLIGRTFPKSQGLSEAATGRIVANYDRFDAVGSGAGPSEPVLEIYNPVLQPWSGEVVAVIEFYERASELQATLSSARLRSWAAVAIVTALFFGLLGTIVLRGSRIIERQARELNGRVEELTALNRRVNRATQQATALNESYLRRLGADLHDGPAQFIALAAMRLDSDEVLEPGDPDRRRQALQSIQSRLLEALDEIRAVCRGLVLPQIENAELATVVGRAIEDYEKRADASVLRLVAVPLPPVPLSQRICTYRFIQETLNNGHRHCRGAAQAVVVDVEGHRLHVAVSDEGPGFDPNAIPRDRIGIAGLKERIESLGGTFTLDTSTKGTIVTMQLDLEEATER